MTYLLSEEEIHERKRRSSYKYIHDHASQNKAGATQQIQAIFYIARQNYKESGDLGGQNIPHKPLI